MFGESCWGFVGVVGDRVNRGGECVVNPLEVLKSCRNSERVGCGQGVEEVVVECWVEFTE